MGTNIEKKIRRMGYDGSSSTVRHYIFKLLYCLLETVKSISQEQFERICDEYPYFEKIHNIIWEFKKVLAGKNADALDQWIEKAKKLGITEIDSFVYGLERDLDAVRNAIKYEYNNGLAEGNINKLKVIKRIMYGRCSFETLRIKTLRLEKMRIFN